MSTNDALKDFLEPRTLTRPIGDELIILVEKGDVFDGTFEHWEKCFFKFHPDDSLEQKIQDVDSYCQHQGWNVEFI